MNKKRRDAVLESFARPIGADETEDEEQGMGDADELSRPLSSKSKGKSKAQERDYSDGKANPRVMLISIQSGALGLNLTSASQVFLSESRAVLHFEHRFLSLTWRWCLDLPLQWILGGKALSRRRLSIAFIVSMPLSLLV